MIYYIGILWSLVCFWSCSRSNSIPIVDSSDVASDIVSFPLDTTQYHKLKYITQYEEDGVEYLVTLDHRNPSFISIYNLKDRKLLKKIPLAYEGPNGVGIPEGLVIVSLDSIFVISPDNYLVSLVDGDGRMLFRHRIIDEGVEYSREGGMLRGQSHAPCMIRDEILYCPSFPDRDPFKNEYYDGSVLMLIDIFNREQVFKYSYPKEYKDDYLVVEMIFFGIAYIDSDVVFSFSISDSLYIYNLEKDIYVTKYAGSQLSPRAPDKYRGSRDLDERFIYMRNSRMYGRLIYDEYRQKYYRYVYHPLDKEDCADNTIENPVSIITLNKDLEIINECLLQTGRYDKRRSFCSKDGFYISLMNDRSPYLNEEKWYFEKLNL